MDQRAEEGSEDPSFGWKSFKDGTLSRLNIALALLSVWDWQTQALNIECRENSNWKSHCETYTGR